MKKRTSLSWARLRELGVLANVDPRTIERVLAGDDVNGMAGARARRVCIEQGELAPPPQGAAQPSPDAGEGVAPGGSGA